jgi:ACR3 family arsenite transporter
MALLKANTVMGIFERFLSVWVGLGILAGLALGLVWPALFQTVAQLEWAHVNLVVALCIWVMIFPMMVQIDWHAVKDVGKKPQGLMLTLVVNWLIKPLTMAALGVLFFQYIFAPWVDPQSANEYIAGMILLGVAPCTAMVFVWSRLTNGDPYFTLSQVAVNDLIMVFAFAPLVALLLGVSSIIVPWDTLLTSVVLYIVIPVIIAQLMRKALLKKGEAHFDGVMTRIQPWSVAALLLTLVLLFAFQGNAIIEQPLVIALLAVPILIQVLFNSGLAYWLNRKVGEKHSVACPSALIGASNFFELAVAAAISLFGFHSGAALATVVGVLIEVPVMLLVVRVVNASKPWYEAGLSR